MFDVLSLIYVSLSVIVYPLPYRFAILAARLGLSRALVRWVSD